MATLLQKFVDANEWQAEDIVGRLGLVMHAAFLSTGFQPYGAHPPSGRLLRRTAGDAPGSLCLSRQYTVPPLARRQGADAAVLLLCAQGSGGGDIALVVFLTTDRRHVRRAYRERLDTSAVAPLLSRALGDTEPWASRICWGLAGGVCWGLLVELCRRNGLPLTSFMSLPDDIKAEILRRLTDGKDLARVEATCRQLRQLVAERDGELWKPVYEALRARRCRRRFLWLLVDAESSDSEREEVLSWKEKYVEASWPRPWASIWRRFFFDSFRIFRYTEVSCLLDGLQDPPEKETVPTPGESAGVHRRKVARNDGYKKKRHGSGVIHSPSSRYRWRHR